MTRKTPPLQRLDSPPSSFATVISIPELADCILCYLPLSDICALRLVSKRSQFAFTTPRHFFKHTVADHSFKITDSNYNNNDINSVSPFTVIKYIPWSQHDRTAQYVRSLSMDMWPDQSVVHNYLILLDKALIECPNLQELDFKGVDTQGSGNGAGRPRGGHLGFRYPQVDGLWRRVVFAAPHLTRLKVEVIPVGHGGNSSAGDDDGEWSGEWSGEWFLSKEMNPSAKSGASGRYERSIRAIDPLLEMFPASLLSNFRFSCLVSFTLAGHKFGKLRTLEWETLTQFLRHTPVLKELTLDRINLGVVSSSRGAINGQEIFTLKALRTLRISTTIYKVVAWEIIKAFPGLHSLFVDSIDKFCTQWRLDGSEPSLQGRIQDSSTPLSNVSWIPFPELKRITTRDQIFSETPLDTKFPPSLVELELNSNKYCSSHRLSEMISPGTSLRLLSLCRITYRLFFEGFHNQAWSRNLTSLTLHNGIWIFREILSSISLETRVGGHNEGEGESEGEGSALLESEAMTITPEADSVESGDYSWECSHITEQFVASRIPFARCLTSLNLGGNDWYTTTTKTNIFLNRLLRSLPKLQDFSLGNSLDELEDLLDGLGRVQNKDIINDDNDVEESTMVSQTEQAQGTEMETGEWVVQCPSLYSISLCVQYNINIKDAVQGILKQFEKMEKVSISLINDSDAWVSFD